MTLASSQLRHDLNDDEVELLQLIGDGLSNKEIARVLSLQEEATKSRVARLLAKLGARTRAQAVGIGFRRGIIA